MKTNVHVALQNVKIQEYLYHTNLISKIYVFIQYKCHSLLSGIRHGTKAKYHLYSQYDNQCIISCVCACVYVAVGVCVCVPRMCGCIIHIVW
jgi:hypothetical protein